MSPIRVENFAMTNAEILAQFRGCPVLVVGDLMLDEFIWGTVNRISPEAPVPVVEVSRRSFVPGGAANTAANISSLGGKPILAGVVGEDGNGVQVCDLLQKSGVETGPVVRDSSRPTTTKTRVIAHSQQIVRIDHEVPGAMPARVEAALLARIQAVLPTVRGCVVSDYGKGVITSSFVTQLIELARAAKLPIIIDPKGTDYQKYRGATLVKPNQLEAGKVLNRDLSTSEDVERAGADLVAEFGPNTAILITRGPHGMSLFEPNCPAIHIPAQAREVYDVTGAGDTVAGTMALTLAVGGTLETASRLATLAAAIVVAKVGTATCTHDELQAAHDKMGW